MQVPELNIHSQRRKNSIFERKRYSPSRDTDGVSAALGRADHISHRRHVNQQRTERVGSYTLSSTLPEPIPVIHEIPAPIGLPRAVPSLSPKRRSPKRRRFSYLDQPIDIPYEAIERELLTPALIPANPYIHNPYIHPYLDPVPLAVPLPLPLTLPVPLLPPQPFFLHDDVSSLLTSPIIHEAPSTYFQLSQRILSGTIPRSIPSTYSLLRQRQSFLNNYRRQSPTRDQRRSVNNSGSDKKGGDKEGGNKNLKENENTINIGGGNRQIQGSHVSFGGNNSNNHNNSNNSGVHKNQQSISQEQTYQIFRTILKQLKIQSPPQYPTQWEQIIKRSGILSKEQMVKLIRQELETWRTQHRRRIREQITQETRDINNEGVERTLNRVQADAQTFQQKMANLFKQMEKCNSRMEENANSKQGEIDFKGVDESKESYINSKNQQILRVEELIQQADERIVANVEPVPVFKYFQC